MEYQFFDRYVLRTPILPLQSYLGLLEKSKITDSDLTHYCENTIIMEAIYIASPSFYQELIKWHSGHIKSQEYSKRIKISLLKYLCRMSSRCTPFGLFAGITIGKFGNSTKILLNRKEENKRRTRLDMILVISLSQELEKKEIIKNQLRYFPNSSIYTVGNQLRYIEYSYKDENRTHEISAVRHSDYIKKVLIKARNGLTINDLANELADDEITFEEAQGFIQDMIENQLLVSSLEPSVSGPEFQEQLFTEISSLENVEPIVQYLSGINKSLQSLDNSLGNPISEYQEIRKYLEKIGVKNLSPYAVQTDMVQGDHINTLSKKFMPKIRRALILLNRITLPIGQSHLDKFVKNFYKRYGHREVSLPKIMDIELGIGFEQNHDYGDINDFVDDLEFPLENDIPKMVEWNEVYDLLQKRLIECIIRKERILKLQESDFNVFDLNWDDLPDTISGMIEIVQIEGEEKLFIPGFSGSSAANLMGRFCHLDNRIHDFTKEIVDKEQQLNPDKIMAEIVHLPKDRFGNVLMRPSFREYEIPYLSKSTLPPENQIDINDLYVHIDSQKSLKLILKRNNKEVYPRLTNAHNYKKGQLPLYQFLANMQSSCKRGAIGFTWGPIVNVFDHLPRVEYDGIILSKAMWKVSYKEIQQLKQVQDGKKKFLGAIKEFCAQRQIPKYVSVVDGDNTLLINTHNKTSMEMLIQCANDQKPLILEEFLHYGKSPVVSEQGHFVNQFIIALYNGKKQNKL